MKKILFLCVSVSLFSRPLEIEVSARSAILMNAETGAILYEKHSRIPMYPASITKIATALYALDAKKLRLDTKLTVSHEALRIKPVDVEGDFPPYWGDVAGTKMGLVKGEVVPFESLLYGLMRVSGNDAANVIAENLSTSIPFFVSELNQYLSSLGCRDTRFSNPHGLHHEDHFTTAYDMCLITKKALTIPKFRELVSNTHYQKPETNKQSSSEIRQSNALLKPGKHYYSKAIGVKTGFHSKAMYTLVAAAEEKGRTLIAVLLGCPKKSDRYEDAISLFNLAFSEKKEERVFFDQSHLFSRSIEGAKTLLQASVRSDVSISYFPSEEPDCKAFVYWEIPPLPIHPGQRVGVIQICDHSGAVLCSESLLAKEAVQSTFFHWIKSFFGF